MGRESFLDRFYLCVKIPFAFHVTGRNSIKLRFEGSKLSDILACGLVGQGASYQKSTHEKGNDNFFHHKKEKINPFPLKARLPIRTTFNVNLSHPVARTK